MYLFPSLINSASSESSKNIDYAVEQLRMLVTEGTTVSIASVNLILACIATRGDIERMVALMDICASWSLPPNEDTFDLAFQTVCVYMHRMDRMGTERREHIERTRGSAAASHFLFEDGNAAQDKCVALSEQLLVQMEAMKIEPSHLTMRWYLDILCTIGQVDTAASMIEEASKSQPHIVPSKGVTRITGIYISNNLFDAARAVAGCMPGGRSRLLEERINRAEQNANIGPPTTHTRSSHYELDDKNV